MSQMITISLPDETRTALDDAANEEGLSENALVEKALSDYLFIRRFRNLRERLMSQGKDLTDQDVFDLVKNIRSEEHTSELQSRGHLVCRLLLEKKKSRCGPYCL